MNNNTQRSAEEIAEAIWKRGQMGKPCTEEICKRAIVEALSLERQEAEKWRMAFNTVIDQKGDLLQEKIRYFEEAEKLRQVIGYNPKIDDMDSITYAQAVMQQFREAVKEVEKLHQENEVLKNEIQNLRSYCMVTFGESHPEMRKCIHELENEALKAQVSGLVRALRECGCQSIKEEGCDEGKPNCSSCIALSTLPSTFLEIQKAKDACVEALKKTRCGWDFYPTCIEAQKARNDHKPYVDYGKDIVPCERCKALRTLQQAKENK